jgi:hypothetical protein
MIVLHCDLEKGTEFRVLGSAHTTEISICKGRGLIEGKQIKILHKNIIIYNKIRRKLSSAAIHIRAIARSTVQ